MRKMHEVCIFGAGGHGRVVLDILLESGEKVMGFLDDDKDKAGMSIDGYPVLGDLSWLNGKKGIVLALGIGNNLVRRKVFEMAVAKKIKVISAIHPKAIISRTVKISEGVVVMPGAVINTGVIIGKGVVVNTSASVDHDCILNDFCQIWPGATLAGSVIVGENSYIGAGASVIQNIKIGKDVIVGAGAVVIRNVSDNSKVIGVPAREMGDDNA